MVGHAGARLSAAWACLVIAAALAVVGQGGRPLLPTVGLTVVTGLLLLGMVSPRADRPVLRGVYYVALLAMLTWLVVWSPWFMLASWVACVYGFWLLEAHWALFGAAGAGVALTLAQVRYPFPGRSPASLPLCLLSMATPLMVAGWRLARVSEERRRLVDELTRASQANERLRDRLLAQARVAGAHQERQRLAREIHDTLAQGLSAISTQLEVALATGPEGGRWRRQVTLARDLSRESLSEARRSVYALTPKPLDGATLPEALRGLATRWGERTGIAVSCRVDEDMPVLTPEVESALLRIAQAALGNVDEHAQASSTCVTLTHTDDAVILDVWDNGVGFDPAHAGSTSDDRGFGLAGMRQRAAAVGGRLRVDSAPSGEGTVISAQVPLTTGDHS